MSIVFAALVTTVWACDSGPPSVNIIGGGFIFNYRIAEAYYGVVAELKGDIPDGAVLEAEFEHPAGSEAIIVTQPVITGRPRYKFETPPLTGIVADHPYRVVLRLLAPGGGELLAEATRTFKSDVGQDMLPERPLSIGPGYHRPPEPNAENNRSNPP